jgi:hypothetical protein
MGFLIHELVALELANRYHGIWRKAKIACEKDLVYVPDERYSVEIKTSSHKKSIFGNRSYAQKSEKRKKDKSGYYLAINFEKFSDQKLDPGIQLVRFGWLDHEDWTGQVSATGQQAKLSSDVENNKLLKLPLEK